MDSLRNVSIADQPILSVAPKQNKYGMLTTKEEQQSK
jgi:hypothetical protein